MSRPPCALKHLGQPISLRTIARMAESIDGNPLSTETIRRNEAAYGLYVEARTARPLLKLRGNNAFTELLSTANADERAGLLSRARYLRRKPKNDLIARLLASELLLSRREEEATRLRNEILALFDQLAAHEPRPNRPTVLSV